jgi:type IV secretory pathway TraG/TraD family ATPase VirD4
VPEGELHARAPVLRLVIESLFSQMLRYADEAPGETPAEKGLRPVLVMLDEAGTIGLPGLPTYTATCRSRGISIWASFQDNSQIEHYYRGQAKAIRNNMAAKIFYQQDEYETAKNIADALGYKSGYSRSETLRDGEVATEGRSETAIPLFTAQVLVILKYFTSVSPPFRLDTTEKPSPAGRNNSGQEFARQVFL